MKLISLLEQLKNKTSFNGEYKEYSFYDGDTYIGVINLRLKKGWNQLHIDVDPTQQKKGYAQQMILQVVDDVKYITIPEGRVINNDVYKVIDKIKQNPKYEVFKTEYDEWVISNKKLTSEEILDIFK